MRKLELILIRHGQSEANVGLSADPDCVLTPRGLEQSRALGLRLRALGIDASFTGIVSPYQRARQTAAELTAATNIPFEVDDSIREWGPPTIIDRRHFPLESEDELFDRITRFFAARHGRLLVVSHGSPIGLMTQLALGLRPPRIDPALWLEVENCCLRWLIAALD